MSAQENSSENQDLFTITASCSTFNHPNESIATFRSRVRIYCGDFDLKVCAIERSKMGWSDFREAVGRQKSRDRFEQNGTAAGKTPSEILGDFANFDELYWSWSEYNGVGGVYAKAPDGRSFLPRIWVRFGPEKTHLDVRSAKTAALSTLEKFPSAIDGQGFLTKDEFKDAIIKDFALLEDILLTSGLSWGDTVLPGGSDPIEKSKYYYRDGNCREALFRTQKYKYYILCQTS